MALELRVTVVTEVHKYHLLFYMQISVGSRFHEKAAGD